MTGAVAFGFLMFMVAYIAITAIPTLVARRRNHRQLPAIVVLGVVTLISGYFAPFVVYAVLFVIGLIWAYYRPADAVAGPVVIPGPQGPRGEKGDKGEDAIPLTDGRGFLKNRVAGE